MTSEAWKRIERVLDTVLENDPARWPAVIEKACGNDDLLRNEVETLLRHYPDIQSFLQSPAVDGLGSLTFDREHIDSTYGKDFPVVGKYRIIREIAHGGMGRVFLAERADGQFDQQVALKLLHSDLDTENMRRRFRAERQILASLNHPNIARLLDGGVTKSLYEEGENRPYLVMEYIEGKPIVQYCYDHDLTIRERLKLFIKVAETVQHAHRNLIIHCDIKPSNILITEEGEVKLLDFGIARMLDENVSSMPLATQTLRRWMTPEYAAPEQIRGERPTTSTDVYQLGVLLYELLTGHRPFELTGENIRKLEQDIVEIDPAIPSLTVHSNVISRTLYGDLDAIILKALRKESGARYESASAFIDDVGRYLSGQPVTARRGNIGYRAGKFVHRHRLGVSVTAGILLLTGTLIGFYTHQLTIERDRAGQAALQAQVEAETAEQVAEFLMGLFEASRPERARGTEITARDLLVQGVEQAELLHDQPEVQARMFSVIGKTYHRFGMYDEARELYERALTIREQHFGSDHEQVAESLNDLGVILRNRGEYDLAEQFLRRAVAMRRALFDNDRNELAISIEELGRLLRDRGNYEEAESLFREGLEMRRRIFGNEHHETVASLSSVALLLRDLGDFEGAEPLFREALATYLNILEDNHPWIATAKSNLALVLINLQQLEEAESLLHKALEIERATLDDNHPDLAIRLNHLGSIYRNQSRYRQADSVLSHAVQITRSALGDAHPWLGIFLQNHGRVHIEWGNAGIAESILREAFDIHRRVYPEGDWRTAEAGGWLGKALADLGRYDEAETLMLESFRAFEHRWGLQDRRTRTVLERVIDFYQAWDQPEAAESYLTLLEANKPAD